MGKTRAECSQNAYTSAFLSHWIQILANSSPKSDIKKKKKKKKKTTLFFRILRSVGRGQHNFFFWPSNSISHRVLVDFNEFSSVFWKVLHSHSRHPSENNLKHPAYNHFKDSMKISNEWSLEGGMYINLW